MTAARSSTVSVSSRDPEAEFERFAASLLGGGVEESGRTKRRFGSGSRGPQPSISAQFIHEYALELVDCEGIDALTVRRLGAELKISTRTLYKRIGSRESLIRVLTDLHFARLDLRFRQGGTWEETVWGWCLQLHHTLTARPHLTLLSQGQTLAAATTYVDTLVETTIGEGKSADVANDCCRSLADLIVNDAIAASLKAVTDRRAPSTAQICVEPSKTTTDAIRWILRGVGAETATTSSGRDVR